MDINSVDVDFAALRLRVGTNHFKKLLLGNKHVAGQAQTQLVMDALDQVTLLAERTWASWFEDMPPTPRKATVAGLDRCASLCFAVKNESDDFYQELIAGGLVQRLLLPTESKSPKLILQQRAEEYWPQSPLHLHLDAIEAVGLSEGNSAASGDLVKLIAVKRIIEVLDSRWCHNSGLMYNGSEPTVIPTEMSLLKLLYFFAKKTEERPTFRAWNLTYRKPHREAVEGNSLLATEQVHRTMLAIAGDCGLIQNDIIESLGLDLLSAVLVLHYLAYTKRHTVCRDRWAADIFYFDSLITIYLRTQNILRTVELIGCIHKAGKFVWSHGAYMFLTSAQSAYQAAASDFALSKELIDKIYLGCKREYA